MAEVDKDVVLVGVSGKSIEALQEKLEVVLDASLNAALGDAERQRVVFEQAVALGVLFHLQMLAIAETSPELAASLESMVEERLEEGLVDAEASS